jgi:hypothetical protein
LADEAFRLDLAWMMRTGLAVPGEARAGTLNWTWGGEPSASASYDVDMTGEGEGRVMLAYARGTGEARREIRQTIRLVSTPLHFGGRRWWMICPFSGARCGKLYRPYGGDRFASRTVWRLGYRSQRLAGHDTPFERMFRLQKRLGCDQGYDSGLYRPKGMWHRTFERHWERFEQIDQQCSIEWGRLVNRMNTFADR